MPDGKAPPSKFEKEKLIQDRKNDQPVAAPAPRPTLAGAGVVDRRAHWEKTKQAHIREYRIKDIDKSLHAQRGRSKNAFDRSR